MKMDAMQKQRMWKVAITHFLIFISVCVVGTNVQSDLWQKAWFLVGLLLQPQISLTLLTPDFDVPPGSMLAGFIEGIALLISIPLWSICFGWLYVEFKNWLNRFPVLGKKVF